MEQGLWVPLWYYTNHGLTNRATFDSMEDDELTLIMGPGGIMTTMQSTNLRDSKGMVDDQNLTFEQFELVAIHMLTAMHQCRWTDEQIIMMETFWTNIIDHPFRSLLDDCDVQALLLYQAEQRTQ